MAERDEFFSSEEIDRQIEKVSQFREGDRLDAEALAYLRSYYRADVQQEQEALARMWQRIANSQLLAQDRQVSEKEQPMQNPIHDSHMPYDAGVMGSFREVRPRRSLRQRLGTLAAVVFLLLLVGGMTIVFYAAHQTNSASHPPAPAHGQFSVTAVTMAVTPGSLANLSCGTTMAVTYKATIHVAPGSSGGIVRFNYTLNNGRSQTPASVTFAPGQTVKTYTFVWKGALPADHTAPGPGGIQVTSPNQLTSALVQPTGQCVAAKFQVTKVVMAVSPASIQGLACGTSAVVTYKATIYVTPGSSGGVVQFSYTLNNGRGQTPASVTFAPGQTSRVYTFTWSGTLPADHTAPGLGGIQVTSPNQLTSTLIQPAGTCS